MNLRTIVEAGCTVKDCLQYPECSDCSELNKLHNKTALFTREIPLSVVALSVIISAIIGLVVNLK